MILKQPNSYSSKIIKAGAILAETKTLLLQWDRAASMHPRGLYLDASLVFGQPFL